MKTKLTSLALAITLASTSGATFGQALEEIVVTAQKREQSLQDVPLSVQALSGEQLLAQGISRLEDISESVPNVEINQGATGPAVSIRGIRTSSNSASFEQSVGTFSDGAYVGRSWQTLVPFLDIERVEVLRGAQPTFFGQNVIAGAFNITTRGPGDEFDGFINAESGTYTDAVEGAVSIPVSDTFGLRVAGRWQDREGYVENLGVGEDLGGIDQTALRVIGEWEASDNFDVRFKYETASQDQSHAPMEVELVCNYGVLVPTNVPGVGLVDLPPGCETTSGLDPDGGSTYDYIASTSYVGYVGNDWTTSSPASNTIDEATDEIDSDLFQLTLNYDFGFATLNSNTLWSEYENFIFRDLTGFGDAGFESYRWEAFESTATELRLTSNEPAFDGLLDWMVGLYYSTSEVDAEAISGGGMGPTSGYEGTDDTDYTSAFAALTLNITDSFRANLGLRAIDVDKTSRQIASASPYAGFAWQEPDLNVAQMHADVIGNYTDATSANLAANTCTGAADGCLDDTINESDESYELGVQWDVTDGTMLYAKYYDSFKQGAFNISQVNVPGGAGEEGGNVVLPEEVTGFEIGAKSDFFDGRARFNISAFSSEYDNFQQSEFDFAVGAFVAENVGQVSIDGIEFDLTFAASEEVTLTLAGALMDSTYGEGSIYPCNYFERELGAPTEADCADGTIDRNGQDMINNPDWTLNFDADYMGQITDSLMLTGNIGFSGRDGTYTSTSFNEKSYQDAYVLLNARLGIAGVDGNWSATLYGRNLTDERVLNVSGPGGNDASGQVLNGPAVQTEFGQVTSLYQVDREIGLQVRYNF